MMTLNNNSKKFLAIASFMMALSIALGAFGAHGLKSIVTDSMLKIYNTGIQYQFYNTLGLFFVAFLINFKPQSKKLRISAWLIILGMLIFSCSLYALVLLNLPILGAITPIGGTLLIVAWLMVTYSLLKD
ncbi:MAG: DUF423 domain-containing protein [Poseidonibacter sp.]